MSKDFIVFIIIVFQISKINCLETEDIPIYKVPKTARHKHVYPLLSLDQSNKSSCMSKNKLGECSKDDENPERLGKNYKSVKDNAYHVHNVNRMNSLINDVQPIYQHLHLTNPTTAMNMSPRMFSNNRMYPIQGPTYTTPSLAPVSTLNRLLNNNLYRFPPIQIPSSNALTPVTGYNSNLVFKPTVPINHGMTESSLLYPISIWEKLLRSLDQFERKFYMVTFTKLTSISPPNRQVNGMSFVQSGFFLHLTLMALSTEVDALSKAEIERTIGFHASDMDIRNVIQEFISSLPTNSERLKFRSASRLVLWPGRNVSSRFRTGPAAALRLNLDAFKGTEKPDQLHNILNDMIEADSGGAIRNTFDEDDLSNGVTAVMVTTLYFRSLWRTAPTVLNGTWPFYDADDAPKRTVRMIKVNDIMGYADIKEWNAQALEIPYATPGLSLVIILPREPSLRKLTEHVTASSINNVISRMKRMRIAAILPLYTLRMTLLLPNKLQAMGVSRLVDVSNLKPGDPLRLSHMVQRIMFWAEAGRNAYKDDGIEWDKTPDMQLLVDRPYIFYVRWHNLSLMNGNFVL